jgi:hypothetical protein
LRRRQKHGFVPPLVPITGDEVARIMRQSTAHGPYFSDETCTIFAEVMTKNIGMFTWEASRNPINIRLLEAAKFLRRQLENEEGMSWSVWQLRQALDTATPALTLPKPPHSVPAWAGIAPVVWGVCAGCLETAGKTRNSVAVKFTTLMLHRMGLPDATDSAVATWITKLDLE